MSNWDTKFLKKGYTFDDVLLILYPLVQPVPKKSIYNSVSKVLQLLSIHKKVWQKLASDL